MPKFKHSYIDFSKGEISDKNVYIYTSTENKTAVSLLDNAFTTKTKGLKRRTGTLLGPKLFYPLDSENPDVKSFTFYIDDETSFLGVMYPVLATDLSEPDKTFFETNAQIQTGSRAMVFEFFKFENDLFTFKTRLLIPFSYSDTSQILNGFFLENILKNFSEDWVEVKEFTFERFQNIGVFTHTSGKIEPFCVFFNGATFEFSTLKYMLQVTDPGRYPFFGDSLVGYTPLTLANSNPALALEIERVSGVATQVFYLTARVKVGTSFFQDFSDSIGYTGVHPFKGLNTIVRLNVLGKSYYLKYRSSESSPGNFVYLKDPSDTSDPDYGDRALFDIIEDQSGTDSLHTVISTNRDESDFQVDAFNIHTSYPTTSEIYSQRLVLRNNSAFFASTVGNLFFFNQFRLEGDPLTSIYKGGITAKTDSDPFNFSPVQKNFSSKSWLSSSGRFLELGGLTNVQNISGTDDSVFSFTSVRAEIGTTEGSTKAIAEKLSSFTLFIGSNNKSLRDYRFDGRIRSYVSNDLTQLNPEIVNHLYDGSNFDEVNISEMSIDTDKDIIYLTLQPAKSVVAFRYSSSDGISSWARVTLGNETNNPVPIYSTSYLILGDRSEGVTVFLTSRNGQTYIEYLSLELQDVDANPVTRKGIFDYKDLFSYLDFSTRFVDPVAKRVWDLGVEYERKNISVIADGYLISNVGIGPDGILTLDRDVKSVIVGYPYVSRFRFLPIEPSQNSLGDTLADVKHINEVHLRLHNSYGGYIKTTDSQYNEKIPYDSDNMIVGESLDMFTGYVEISPEICSSEDVSVEIETSLPYPFEISAVVIKGEVNEG